MINKLVKAELDRIRETWCATMHEQMDMNCNELYRLQPWQLFEAMQYLVDAICTYLDMLMPVGVSFCFMNSVEEPCECELLLFWNMLGTKEPRLDPHKLVAGKSMQLDEFPWPGRRALSTGPAPTAVLIDTIQAWTYRLSIVKDIMEGK